MKPNTPHPSSHQVAGRRPKPPPLSDAVRALLSPAGERRYRRASSWHPELPLDLPDPYEGLLSPRQAAEFLDVTERTLRNWRQAGLLAPARRLRGRIFYRLDDLLRLFGDEGEQDTE